MSRRLLSRAPMSSVILFRVLLLPAAVSFVMLAAVFLDYLDKRSIIALSVPGGDGQAVGMSLLLYGIPLFIIGGGIFSVKKQRSPGALRYGNFLLLSLIAVFALLALAS